MNEVITVLWDIARLLGGACAVAFLALVLAGIVRGIVKIIRKGGGEHGR